VGARRKGGNVDMIDILSDWAGQNRKSMGCHCNSIPMRVCGCRRPWLAQCPNGRRKLLCAAIVWNQTRPSKRFWSFACARHKSLYPVSKSRPPPLTAPTLHRLMRPGRILCPRQRIPLSSMPAWCDRCPTLACVRRMNRGTGPVLLATGAK